MHSWFGACCLGTVMLAAGFASANAQSVGTPFGARDPQVCSDRSEPQSGAITPDIATRYFVCGTEKVSGDRLYLVGTVKLQVGKGRPFLYSTDGRQSDIDPDQPVYPIRGSYTSISCSAESDILQNAGKNCMIYDLPNAVGICYRTLFADWHCNMYDIMNNTNVVQYGAPPPQ